MTEKTIEDLEQEFFGNYLSNKPRYKQALSNPSILRQLVKDYNEIFDKLPPNKRSSTYNELFPLNTPEQKERIANFESFLRGRLSFTKFIESEVDLPKGVREKILDIGLDKYDLPTKEFSYFFEGEKPTPKVVAKSVTPREKPPPELGREPTHPYEAREAAKQKIDAAAQEDIEKRVKEKKGSLRGRKLTDLQPKERTIEQQEATARGEGAGIEDVEEKPEAREPLPLEMTEPDPTPVEVAEGKFRPNENNDPIADLEPPTLSPDERDQQAVQVEVDRPPPQPPQPPPPPQPPQQQQQVETTDIQGRAEGQPIVEKKVKSGLEDLPNKIDLIPKERLSADFKSAGELQNDIEYFFKMFPSLLRQIKQSYDNFPNKTLPYLRRIHRQIVALLQGGKGEKKKIGVILEGEEFIKQKLKEIILEMKAEGMTNEELLVNVEGEDETKKNDFGNYEVVAGESGLLHSQREPVYRYIPKTLKTVVPAEKVLEDKSMRARTQNLPTRFRSLYTYNANRNQNNPFTKPTSQIKLKYLY
jgi:hypothetical protein